jgi:release factor glutamine methyltransferase
MNRMNRQRAWQWGTAELQQAQVADARWQAELLLRSALRETRARFLAALSQEIDDKSWQHFVRWIDARSQGSPLQYLIGSQEFMGLEIAVTPAVLIPRPDTEVLVEQAIRLLECHPAPRVADLATGSGAIALALAHHLPRAQVIATDISQEALQVAQANAARLGLTERIQWHLGSWAEPLIGGPPLQAIVSNPPYIPSAAIATLSADVRREPRLALDGGSDGLDCYRALIPQAKTLLDPDGHLLLEVGAGQASDVCQLLRRAGFRRLHTVPDLAGIQRVVISSPERYTGTRTAYPSVVENTALTH